MTAFKKFKKIKSILNEIPGIKTYKEFDILIEIGYHQERGMPLTLKQLMLLEVASQATVRRYLGRLVRDGMVEKIESVNDRRSAMLQLSTSTIRTLTSQLSKIIEHLGEMTGETSSKTRSKKNKKT